MVKRHVFIFALITVTLIALALTPLYASEPPFAPFATCADGKCVMSESDYNTYRAWHFALINKLKEANQQNSELEEQVSNLQARLVHNAYCEGQRS